jgi:hypothetical protein
MRLRIPIVGVPVTLLAMLVLFSGCNEGQKPTPLKRFDPSIGPAAEKKDKEPETEKEPSKPPDK